MTPQAHGRSSLAAQADPGLTVPGGGMTGDKLADRDRPAAGDSRCQPDPQRSPLGARHVVRQRHVEGEPAARSAARHHRNIDQHLVVAIEHGDPELRLEDVGETRDPTGIQQGGTPRRPIDEDHGQVMVAVRRPGDGLVQDDCLGRTGVRAAIKEKS